MSREMILIPKEKYEHLLMRGDNEKSDNVKPKKDVDEVKSDEAKTGDNRKEVTTQTNAQDKVNENVVGKEKLQSKKKKKTANMIGYGIKNRKTRKVVQLSPAVMLEHMTKVKAGINSKSERKWLKFKI